MNPRELETRNQEPETEDEEPETPRPLIVAHRGASALAPENTIAAFDRAIADGAEGIEFDVRLASDGVPVVIHDSHLRRVSGLDKSVAGLSSKELAKTNVGAWFAQAAPERWSPAYDGETVPTLEAVLDRLSDFRGVLYVELKSETVEMLDQLVPAVCGVVSRSKVSDRAIIKSFHLSFIPQVRHTCPGIRTAALFAPKIMTILRKEKYLVDLAHEFGADEISVHYSLATNKLMKKADKLNLPVTIWTADHPRWLKRGIKLGLNAIITNDPGRLIEKREEILRRG